MLKIIKNLYNSTALCAVQVPPKTTTSNRFTATNLPSVMAQFGAPVPARLSATTGIWVESPSPTTNSFWLKNISIPTIRKLIQIHTNSCTKTTVYLYISEHRKSSQRNNNGFKNSLSRKLLKMPSRSKLSKMSLIEQMCIGRMRD